MLYSVSTNTHKEIDLYFHGNVTDITVIEYRENIDMVEIKYSYSTDGRTYSEYFSDLDVFKNNILGKSELMIRINFAAVKLNNLDKTLFGFDVIINNIEIDKSSVKAARIINNSDILITYKTGNLYNPYRLSDNQKILQNKMSKSMSDIFGFDVTYFKTFHEMENSSITFKEYTFGTAKQGKEIRIVVKDNYIPDNRTRFAEFDLDFQDELEIHIDKSVFAEAFGDEIPNSDDFFYFPLTKRMYTVNTPYNEKNFMQNDPFWKMTCVKYEDRSSVVKNDFVVDEVDDLIDFVDDFYKDEYQDEKDDATGEGIITPSDENNIGECYMTYNGNEIFRYFYDYNNWMTAKKYEFNPKDEFTFLSWFNLNEKTKSIINIDDVIKLDIQNNNFRLIAETSNILPTQTRISDLEVFYDEWFGIVISYSKLPGKIGVTLYIVDCSLNILEEINIPFTLIDNPNKIEISGLLSFANVRVNKKKLSPVGILGFKEKLIEKIPVNKENYIIDNAVPGLSEPKLEE